MATRDVCKSTRLKEYRPGLLKRLRDTKYAAGYLADVLEFESQEAFLIALRNVLDARRANITHLSKSSGVSRQAVYHALSKRGNPRLSTLNQLLRSVRLRINFDPIATKK